MKRNKRSRGYALAIAAAMLATGLFLGSSPVSANVVTDQEETVVEGGAIEFNPGDWIGGIEEKEEPVEGVYGNRTPGKAATIEVSGTLAQKYTFFKVFRSLEPGSTVEQCVEVGDIPLNMPRLKLTDFGLEPGLTYYYKFKASNGEEDSEFLKDKDGEELVLSKTMGTDEKKVAKYIGEILMSEAPAAGNVKLYWDILLTPATDSRPTQYDVMRAEYPSNKFTRIGTATGEVKTLNDEQVVMGPAFEDTSAEAGKTYYYYFSDPANVGTKEDTKENILYSSYAKKVVVPDTPGETTPPATTEPGETTPPATTEPGETTPPATTEPGETTPPATTEPGETTPPATTEPGETTPPATTEPGETTPPVTPSKKAPGRPLAFQAKAAGLDSATLTWAPAANATGYNIYRAASKDGPFTKIESVGAVSTYTDESAPSDAESWYYITGTNEHGEGTPSVMKGVKLISTIEMKYSGPQIWGADAYRIEWNSVSKARRYTLYRSVDGENFTPLHTSIVLGYVDLNVDMETTYTYKVVSDNGAEATLIVPTRPAM